MNNTKVAEWIKAKSKEFASIILDKPHSPIGIELKEFKRKDGTAYLSADTSYTGQRCPFCGSENYGGGGSWSPDGCLDCEAVYHMGWVKEVNT